MMYIPLPIKAVENYIDRVSSPVLVAGAVIAIPSLVFHSLTGALYPADIAPWDKDPLEITGLVLLMSFMPAYLAMCFVATTRLSRVMHRNLKTILPADFELDGMVYRWGKGWPLALAVSLCYAFGFNIGWYSMSLSPDDPRFGVSFSIVVGQSLVWGVGGTLLYFKVHEALVLHRLGKIVQFDLYYIDALNDFGKTALNGFLIIVGVIALTFLQSINQTFVLENYANAFIVVIPAIFVMVPLPIWSIHRRIQQAKIELLTQIDSNIIHASKALEGEDLHLLNSLMQRREHIQKMRNWPMDFSISTKFFLYVFIVPMAWAGAALMEILLDTVLGI